MDQSNWSVREEYISIFHPNIPPVILGMVNGYVATDTVVPSVENILCNKLNIQPFLVKYASIYCTLSREYFPRPPEIFLPWVQYIPIFHAEGLNIYNMYIQSTKLIYFYKGEFIGTSSI